MSWAVKVLLCTAATQADALKFQPEAPKAFQVTIPNGTKKVMIDIGLYNKILQPEPDEFVIAIDASLREIERNRLFSLCSGIQRCTLINAAVGKSEDVLVNLHQSKREGGSSHITTYDANVWPMEMRDAIVPVISLEKIIESVPSDIPISLCKTDTNGNDVYVLESAGQSLKRCQRLTVEIVGNKDGTGPADQYETVQRLATAQGFQFAKNKVSTKRDHGSYNVYYVRPEIADMTDLHIWDQETDVTLQH